MVFFPLRRRVLLAAWTLLPAGIACSAVAAQTAVVASSTDPGTVALRALAARAGTIFAGQVQTVTRHDASGFVDVRFHIDLPVRGCPQTGVYVLREWAGLWAQAQAPRYVAGERYLLLLTARGPSGLSAPVDNTDGAIRLLPVADGYTSTGPLPDLGNFAVDLRWLRAKAERPAAPVWARSSGDDLNQPLGSSSGPDAEHVAGAISPLAAVRREPLLASVLPLLSHAKHESHAAN